MTPEKKKIGEAENRRAKCFDIYKESKLFGSLYSNRRTTLFNGEYQWRPLYHH